MPDATITVERLVAVDDADVAEITALLAPLIRADAALGWTEPPGAVAVRELLSSLVSAGAGQACVAVARAGGRAVGFGYWRRYSRPTHRPHADVEKLAVAADFAGQGIGRSLLRELIAAARDARVEQLTLDFRGDNHRAEQLYLAEGFREYGRLPDFVAPDGARRFDMVLHVLDLRRP